MLRPNKPEASRTTAHPNPTPLSTRQPHDGRPYADSVPNDSDVLPRFYEIFFRVDGRREIAGDVGGAWDFRVECQLPYWTRRL